MSDALKAVFLSYAREDAVVAQRIAEALRASGLEVWFDQNELRGGDQWDQKIRTQIKTCALFVPIVSVQTEARPEGYFRREWKLAVDRTHDMGSNRAFIVPVVIDGTKEAGADVPEDFMRYQWTRLDGGVPNPEFVAQVKRLLDGPKKASFKAPTPAAAGTTPPAASTGSASRALRVIGAVALLAVATMVFWFLRPTPKGTAASTKLAAQNSAKSEKVAEKSVAVLAFADMSEARNSEYIADGISEELLNVLAKVPGLRVAARTSAFHFKGKNLPISEIAAQLKVAYVVEGSVQRVGDTVRITAQLSKADDGYNVWSDRFTKELNNIFAVQDEIAGLIAKNLQLQLGVGTNSASRPVAKPEVFELYLQARAAWNLRTAEGFVRAEELLQRTQALDPDFARAHALLAMVWAVRDQTANKVGRFGDRQSPAVARIQAAIDRALALEPNLAEAHTAQGILFWNSWRFDDAAVSLRRAITLNPSDATAHQILGRVLHVDGRLDEAIVSAGQAAALDPLSHRILDNFGITLLDAGRAAEALAMDERALALQPASVQAGLFRAHSLVALGRHAEAVAQVQRLDLDRVALNYLAVQVFAAAGKSAEAEAAHARSTREYHYQTLAWLGRFDEALAALDPATVSVTGIGSLLFSPVYDSIRQDPRFQKALGTLGLTAAHARAQAWRAAHPGKK